MSLEDKNQEHRRRRCWQGQGRRRRRCWQGQGRRRRRCWRRAQLKTEGKVDQATAAAKEALSDVKDASSEKAGEVADKAKGFVDGLKK